MKFPLLRLAAATVPYTAIRHGAATVPYTIWFLVGLVLAPACLAQSPEERLAAASSLFDQKKFAEAAQQLDSFLAASPDHKRAGAAALALGKCRAELKQWDKAIPAYEKAIATKDESVVNTAQLGLGEAAVNARRFDKAAPALEIALRGKLKPDQEAAAWYWLGQSRYQLGQFADSEIAYLKVIEKFNDADFVDDCYYGAGLAALKQGKKELAYKRFRVIAQQYRKSEDRPQAYLQMGRLDLEAKRFDEARANFETLLSATPIAELRRAGEDGLIQTMLESGDHAGAVSHLQNVLRELPPGDPFRSHAQLSLGHCLYRIKQYDAALAAYQEAGKSSEEAVAAEALYWSGNVQLAQNKTADAAATFNQLTTRYPKHPLAAKAHGKAGDIAAAAAGERIGTLIGRARASLGTKKYADAAAALTTLLKEKLDSSEGSEVQYLLGLSYDGLEKDAQAATALAESLRLDPKAAWAADAGVRLSWLLLELKQPERAEKTAQAAIDSKPPADLDRQAHMALMQAQLDLKKWDAAIESATALLSDNPAEETAAAALYTKAWASDKRMLADQSMAAWEQLVKEYPKSRYAAEGMLRVGDARLKAEKYDEARDQYAALLAGFPKSPVAAEARFKLGSALFNLNQPADAAKEFDAVAGDKSAGDYQPEALYWAGVAFQKADNKDEAISRLTKLTTDYPTHARVANAKIRLAALKAK